MAQVDRKRQLIAAGIGTSGCNELVDGRVIDRSPDPYLAARFPTDLPARELGIRASSPRHLRCPSFGPPLTRPACRRRRQQDVRSTANPIINDGDTRARPITSERVFDGQTLREAAIGRFNERRDKRVADATISRIAFGVHAQKYSGKNPPLSINPLTALCS